MGAVRSRGNVEACIAILNALHAVVDAGEVVRGTFGVGRVRVLVVGGICVFAWVV
jgi:hypothetical protein